MIECDNKLTAGEHVQSERDIKFWSNNILELECMQIMYKKANSIPSGTHKCSNKCFTQAIKIYNE